MPDEPADGPPNAPRRPLDYATPAPDAEIRQPPTRRRDTLIALLLTIVWAWASVMSGVASDFVTIPLPKKLAITLGTTVIFVMLARVWNWGCLIAFALFAAWIVGVMWFWN